MTKKLLYNSFEEWAKANNNAYKWLLRNKHLIPKICAEAGWELPVIKQLRRLTIDECKQDALRFSKQKDWAKFSGRYYQTAYKYGWLDECCGHMIKRKTPMGYWTLEHCKEEALKYEFKVDFINGSRGAYQSAFRNGWLDTCCAHMSSNDTKFKKGETGDRKGVNNPNWKNGGAHPIKTVKKTEEYKTWRNACLKRDGYKCTFCSSTINLRIHNKGPKQTTNFNINDGLTICISCLNKHRKTL